MQNIGIIGSDSDAAELLAACCACEVDQAKALLDARAEPIRQQPAVLIVGSQSIGAQITQALSEKELENIEVRVAASLTEIEAWQPSEPVPFSASLNFWIGDKPAPRPRHRAPFTKQQPPTTKARKAARRRAKAGRKASR